MQNERRSRKKFDFKAKSGELKSILKKQNERMNDSGFGDCFVVSTLTFQV